MGDMTVKATVFRVGTESVVAVEAVSPDGLRNALADVDAMALRSLAVSEDTASSLPSAIEGAWRAAAVVLSDAPADEALGRALRPLFRWLDQGSESGADHRRSAYLRRVRGGPRLGLLFPGQGSPLNLEGGTWSAELASAGVDYPSLAARARAAESPDGLLDTSLAQPAIAGASLTGMRLVERLTCEATLAIGHSLGELSALAWGGGIDRDGLVALACLRGDLMSRFGLKGTGMAGIAAPVAQILQLRGRLDDGAGGNGEEVTAEVEGVWVACVNAPDQTIVAGSRGAVDRLCRASADAGLDVTHLPVSHAFHTPAVAGAVEPFRDVLAGFSIQTPTRRVISTVTGTDIGATPSVPQLLAQQLIAPVQFLGAVRHVGEDVDLWIEVGPGRVLSSLVRRVHTAPSTSLDVGSASSRPLADTVAALWAAGAPLDLSCLPTAYERSATS